MSTVIVGGGLAGLTCAYELALHGQKVHVLESTSRLGGRAQSWKDPTTGDVVDLGPHVLLSTYPNMLRFLRELGTEDLVAWQNDAMIRKMEGTKEIALNFAPLPAPFHFLPSLIAARRLGLRDVLSHGTLFAAAIAMTPEELIRYDAKDALTVLRNFKVTEHAIEEMWRFVGLAILNLPLEECSGTAFMRFVRFLAGKKNYRIGFARVGLGELFTEQAKAEIEKRGGRVELHQEVASLVLENNRVKELKLKSGETLTPEATVLALPPQNVAALLPGNFRDALGIGPIEKLKPCEYFSIYLWFDRPLANRGFWARTYREADLNCDFYDLRQFRKGWENRDSVITSNIIYSQRLGSMSDEELISFTRNELADQVPESKIAKLKHAIVNRIPMAIHCPRPGTETLRPVPRQIKNNLYLAGDWCRTLFPSSMEGACAAGFLAAEQILEDRSVPLRLTRLMDDPGVIHPFAVKNARFWNSALGVLGFGPKA